MNPRPTSLSGLLPFVRPYKGRVALAGRFWYRGDRFVMDQSIPFDVWLHHPGMVIPDYHRSP